MHNNIAIIHDHPAIAGEALLLSLFIMLGFHIVNGSVSKRIDHTVTGAVADNKIVCKRDDFFQVYQDYIFALFIFKGVHNFTSKFECVQISPHIYICVGRIGNPTYFDNGAENNLV
jgi:hypothetical protein